MSIEFTCASCNKHFKVDDGMAGRRVRCKACQAIIQVPQAETGAMPPEAPPLPLDFVPQGTPVVASSVGAGGLNARPPRLPRRQCPACRIAMAGNAAVCPGCGYDTRTGRHVSQRPPAKPFNIITSFSLLRVAAALALITVLIFAAKYSYYLAAKSPSTRIQTWDMSSPSTPLAPTPRAVAQPIFPDRPSAQRINATTLAYSMKIGGTGPGLPMEVRLFLPVGYNGMRSLPCVFIAPAGTRLIHGSALGEGNPPEYLPYVHAGFAVLAYELAGDVPNDTGGSIAYVKLREPMRQFMDADGGMDNARHAVDFVLAKVPEVDPDRLFAAGHSSAATVALDAVANDHRFRAAAAYAPRCDLEAHFADDRSTLERLVTGSSAFLERISPIRHVQDIICPVLLFHADDDSRIPTADNQAFANAMTQAGKEVSFVRVARGDHYQSMIDHGIPAGIAFFQAHGARAGNTPAPVVTTAPAPATHLAPAATGSLPRWDPDQSLLSALAPEIDVDKYAVRPPAGFRLIRSNQHWNWIGDGALGRSVFQVVILNRGGVPGVAAQTTQIPESSAAANAGDANSFGMIGGIRFHRSSSAVSPATRCTYSATDGNRTIIISIIAQDAESLAKLEAAARTIHEIHPSR